MDPYAVLHLPKDFTLEELKSNYKRLALQLHPDKNVVSSEHATEIFKILTASYRELLSEYNIRRDQREFHELRTEARGMTDSKTTPPAPHAMTTDGRFDVSIFNTFFKEHHRDDEVLERGYGDWLKSEQASKGDSKGDTSGTTQQSEHDQHLMLHVDSCTLGRSKLAFCEMGIDGFADLSLASNHSSRFGGGLDIRTAYTDAKEPSIAKGRKAYTNIDELAKARDAPTEKFNDSEADRIEAYAQYMEKEEASRRSRITERDDTARERFERIRLLVES
jgi:curved DNA-binding protein CbpA